MLILDAHAHLGHDVVFDEDSTEEVLLRWHGRCGVAGAIVLKSSNPFSDAAMIAVDYGRRHVLREDWKKVFEPENIQEVLAKMLHLNKAEG